MPCVDCGTEDSTLLYRSGRMSRCYDCQNFLNLVRKETGGGITVTRQEFLEWKATRPRECSYCGISGNDLYALSIVNPRNGKPYESIGVDRISNAHGYDLDNIVPCCGPCNAIRGGVLTFEEMQRLGETLRRIWNDRLAAVPAGSR
jgi:hypothetical protein